MPRTQDALKDFLDSIGISINDTDFFENTLLVMAKVLTYRDIINRDIQCSFDSKQKDWEAKTCFVINNLTDEEANRFHLFFKTYDCSTTYFYSKSTARYIFEVNNDSLYGMLFSLFQNTVNQLIQCQPELIKPYQEKTRAAIVARQAEIREKEEKARAAIHLIEDLDDIILKKINDKYSEDVIHQNLNQMKENILKNLTERADSEVTTAFAQVKNLIDVEMQLSSDLEISQKMDELSLYCKSIQRKLDYVPNRVRYEAPSEIAQNNQSLLSGIFSIFKRVQEYVYPDTDERDEKTSSAKN